MSDQPARLSAGWLPSKLREALAQVPGDAGALPSLPVLEIGVMGQHVLVTFCLGTPPPTLLATAGSHEPAVTLHLIWPYGYWYWQPETGTTAYLGGVPHPGQLPAPYQGLLGQRRQRPPAALLENPAIGRYLALLEEVLLQDWLSPHAPVSPAEKQVARELQQLWNELGEAHYQLYYQARGSVLLAWVARVTYEPCWVEEMLELVATAPPGLLPAQASQGMLFPAWLDGQQCVVVPFFKPVSSGTVTLKPAVELLAACYVAYPTCDVYWHRFSEQQAQAILATTPAPGQPLPTALNGCVAGGLPTTRAARHYYQMVTRLLENGWLVTRHPTTPAEALLATELGEAFTAARTPELTAFYLREAWQLFGWLARAAGKSQP